MECKIIESKEKKEFKPFTIELTIENEIDLIDLFHRLNIAHHELQAIVTQYGTSGKFEPGEDKLFYMIEDIIDDLEIDLGEPEDED